jgi:hypothetical protein
MKKKNYLRLEKNAIPDGEGSSALPIAFFINLSRRAERSAVETRSKNASTT